MLILALVSMVQLGFADINAGDFDDVKGHWAENSIYLVIQHGYMAGKGDGRFDPDGVVTIGEVVAVTSKLQGLEVGENHEGWHWAVPAAEALEYGNDYKLITAFDFMELYVRPAPEMIEPILFSLTQDYDTFRIPATLRYLSSETLNEWKDSQGVIYSDKWSGECSDFCFDILNRPAPKGFIVEAFLATIHKGFGTTHEQRLSGYVSWIDSLRERLEDENGEPFGDEEWERQKQAMIDS